MVTWTPADQRIINEIIVSLKMISRYGGDEEAQTIIVLRACEKLTKLMASLLFRRL